MTPKAKKRPKPPQLSPGQDERDLVMSVLWGPQERDLVLGSLAEHIGVSLLPAKLTLETAASRLVEALEGKAKAKIVAKAAEEMGLILTKDDPKAPKGAVKVERLLREVGEVASTLRDWSDRLERQGLALVIRSSDPGVADTARCCPECRTPQLLLAARGEAERGGKGWSWTFLEEGVVE